jgi:hypothetical protein
MEEITSLEVKMAKADKEITVAIVGEVLMEMGLLLMAFTQVDYPFLTVPLEVMAGVVQVI